MITKERLQELIEQGATIWSEQFREKFLLKDFTNIDFYNGFVSCFYKNRELIINLNKVFETQEEAEWYKEFGCIERTERLELPTWEEIKHDFIDNQQSGGNYCVKEFFGKEQEYSLDIVVWNGEAKVAVSDDDFYEPLTKENYILACRKAKELFLGEKK
jgi:hypothetical protein